MRDVLLVEDFLPQSQLIVPQHHIERAKFPVVDAHNHLPAWHEGAQGIEWDDLVAVMDQVNVRTIVNLSGGTGDRLQQCLDTLDRAYPGRFVTFCSVEWEGLGQPGWAEGAAEQLARDVDGGAKGLKVFKQLGLHVRDSDGKLVMPDDERLAPIWDRAGELGVPVLIHVADPVAFFRPLDRFNERWDELHRHPEWHFYGPEFPTFETLIERLYRLIGRHPDTNFIAAHVGCYPENLELVSQMMDKYPNLCTDISARIAELGRAPYSAREWFIRHQDRILFGTDVSPTPEWYGIYFRFLETRDEYFNYSPHEMPGQGRWRIYGVHLPDEVLEKIYSRNAERLIAMR